MSFLKRLFGGSPAPSEDLEIIGEAEFYKDFTITPTPMQEGGQFRLSAVIEKTVDGEAKRHRLIRADLFPVRDAAESASLQKARRMIDEQGDTLFG